ncbi:MAG TPA: AtpZ/AtpI family protein [Candidatus Limnocylindrales bacterium]|nr:AtpZ/AtpI family protein [Candidatus Limnocylindrales bacterium]
MRKAAGKTTNIDDVEQNLAALAAKRQFLAATSNMGWRLALTVVIPIVGGVKIDEHFKTAPSFTLLGVMLAAVAGCAAVWATIKEINQEQLRDEPKKTNGRKNHV